MFEKVNTPWGHWQVICDESEYKVKRLVVFPGQRLSYQKHFKREEYWTVVQGGAKVVLNDEELVLNKGDRVHIPVEAMHRLSNESEVPLVVIEIQLGTYFGEDDIVRVADDYDRM